MKHWKTTLSLLFLYGLLSFNLFAQSVGDYRTPIAGTTGNWNEPTRWEMYTAGLVWVEAGSSPTSANGLITIGSGGNITITSGITVDQVVVASGGTLTVNSGVSLYIANGDGDDLTVNGTFALAGNLYTNATGETAVINGTMNWSNDNSSVYSEISTHSTAISSTGILNISGSEAKSFRYSGGSIYNSGTINWTGTGAIRGGSNYFVNQSGGIFNALNDASIYYDYGGGGGITFNNAGTFRKSTGSGTTTFTSTTFNNTGTVEVQTGTLALSGGGTHTGSFSISSGKTLSFAETHSIGEGASLTGSGTAQVTGGTVNFTGTTNGATIASTITFNFSSGNLGGSGKLTVDGTMNWSSTGSLATTSLTISSGGFLNISGISNKSFRFGRIYNNGTTIWTGSGHIYGGAGSIFDNLAGATFDIQNDAGVYYDGGGGNEITFNNTGTFKKSAGSGITALSGIILNNTGTMQIDLGTVNISGTFSNFSSNTLTNGTYNVLGTLKFNSANIVTNNAAIILDGASSQILNNTGDVNALANFATNSASKSFTLRNGRNFSTAASTFTNNGTLDCGTNIFSGSGNFTNASGSTLIIGSADGITSSGSSGNIQSSGTRTFSTGANYTYNGTSAQVTGNGLPSQVNNFTSNNSAGVTLTSNLTTAGTLTMTSGNISTGSNTLTLGTSTSSPGTLSRTAGTVLGNFKRWFSNVTVSDVVFPIGTASNYRPASISFTSAPSSGGTITTFFTASDPGASGLPLDDGGTSIVNAGTNGYWTLTTADGLTDGTYNLEINADGFSGVSDYTTLRILKRNTGGAWTLAGTHAAGTGSNASPVLHRTGLTSFSEFGVGSTDANPLPVELTSFTSNVRNNKVELNWQTATEVNSYGFEVESREEKWESDWKKIGFLEGHGNSNSPKYYSFTDQNPSNGIVKYRLKQIDIDGSFSYSNVVEVTCSLLPSTFELFQNYPNPFNPMTTIGFTLAEDGVAILRVFNILGCEVATLMNGELRAGILYQAILDAGNLASGLYFYRLESKNNTLVKKLILMK
ncbi:MAG: T9SS type A sorting domain-containing protein [Ignavibacteria bacterium]|nr:T9SS type A sorting domain-containing protein [Ignavibacteria bacterium]